MKTLPSLLLLVGCLILDGCQKENAPLSQERTAQEAAKEKEQFGSTASDVKPAFTRETLEVPSGTKIHLRLDQAISTKANTSGESFKAHLDQPITVEGNILAPQGSTVIGELTNVDDANRVKGRAQLTLTLRELVIDGQRYSLATQPRTILATGSKKKDAAVIGGSAAAGAIIGAVAGGKKGAAVGAGVGGGGGTGYVLATKGKEVEFAREARLTFTLSDPLKLPVFKK